MTVLLIAACVALYFYDTNTSAGLALSTDVDRIGGQLFEQLGEFTLFLPSMRFDGEWYRLLSSGFVHFSLPHLGLNMLLLWQIGRIIEQTFGALTMATLFVAGVLGGSLGALLIEPETQAGGASGAVFALMGAMAMLQLLAGQNILRNGIAPLLAINVAISFLPFVSLGGHLGGLGMGIVAGSVIGVCRRFGPRVLAAAPVVIAGLALVTFLAAIAVVEPVGLSLPF